MRFTLHQESGRRVAVRYRLPDGSATDVLGDLQRATPESLTVLPYFAAAIHLSADQVIAIRDVPSRVVRPASALTAITKLMHAGWPGLSRHRLGGWVLIASGGFTSRANCALPLGDPGVPVPDALDVVERFYAERQLPPKLQVSTPLGSAAPSPLEVELTRRGYRPDSPTLVQLTELRGRVPACEPSALGLELRWSDFPDETWLGLYRYNGAALPASGYPVITAAPAHYLTAFRDGAAIGCSRLALSNGWAGVTAMQVIEDERGRGVGRALLDEVLDRGAAEGAKYAYLQVMSGNAPAIALYRHAGFTDHHSYRYWTREPGAVT